MASTYVARYEPSFHAELEITVIVDGADTTVQLRHREPKALSRRAHETFTKAMSEVRPFELGALARPNIRDGIRLTARVSDGTATRDVEAWSPDSGPHRTFFAAILVAAQDAYAGDAQASRMLRKVLEYL